MSDPTLWAETAAGVANETNLPLVILGGSTEQGSDAALVANLLRMGGERFLHTDTLECPPRAVYLIAVDEDFSDYTFPMGTSVVDPFGTIREQVGVRVYTLSALEIPSIRADFGDDPEIQQLLLDI